MFDEAWRAARPRASSTPSSTARTGPRLRARFLPYIAGRPHAPTSCAAYQPDDRRAQRLALGHQPAADGFGATPPPRVGDLGLRFDRARLRGRPGLVIREVITLGPASIEGSIKPGETLVAVNGRPVAPGIDLDALLLDRARQAHRADASRTGGRRPRGGGAPGVARRSRRACSTATGSTSRAPMSRRSAAVGSAMSTSPTWARTRSASSTSTSTRRTRASEGVVIDVRNNNGGFVNGYALDVFARRNFLTMTPARLSARPAARRWASGRWARRPCW